MERHFPTLEEAELFAARMRAEGHEAEVMAESIPTFWGAAARGDIRVVVFDQAEDGRPPDPPHPAADLAARVFYGVVLLAVAVVLGWTALETAAWLIGDGLLRAALRVGLFLSALYALAAWSLLLSALFRKGRDPRSRLAPLVHALMSALAVLLSLALLFLDFGW